MELAKSPRPSAEEGRAVFKRGDEEGAGKMRLVVFDAVKFGFDVWWVGVEAAASAVGNACNFVSTLARSRETTAWRKDRRVSCRGAHRDYAATAT